MGGCLFAAPGLAPAAHVSDGLLVDEQGMTMNVFGEKGVPYSKSCARGTASGIHPDYWSIALRYEDLGVPYPPGGASDTMA